MLLEKSRSYILNFNIRRGLLSMPASSKRFHPLRIKNSRILRMPVIILLILSILLLASCQNSNNEADDGKEDSNSIKKYDKTELGGIVYNSKIGMLGENRIFRLQEKQAEKVMCLTDSEGNVIKEEKCPYNYYSFDTDSESRIYIYSEVINEERKRTEMMVYVYDQDLSKVGEINLGYGTLTNGTFILKDIDIDPNSRIILSEPSSEIRVFDFNGKLINTIEYRVVDLDVGEGGKLLALGTREGNRHVVSFIDPATGKTEWEHDLDGSGYSAVVYNRSDKSIYIADGSGIFRYSPDDNTKEYIFDNILSSGIGGFTVGNFAFSPEGILLVASGPQLYKFGVAEGKGTEAETDVCELTLSLFYDNKEVWESTAKEFEIINPNVRIKVIDYREKYGNSYEKYITTLNTELMSGMGPDMLLSGEAPFYTYGEKGFLTDLSDYMKNDPDFSDVSFYMNVIESLKYNGRLYAMPLTFKFQAVIASGTSLRAEEISIDDTQWDWTDFYDICKRVTKDENGDGINEKYAMPKEWENKLLDLLCGGDYSAFIDIEGKKAQFDSEEFRDILELCRAFYMDQLVHPTKFAGDITSSDMDMFTFTTIYINSFSELAHYMARFSEDSVLLRLPGEYGQARVSAGTSISINSSCKSRDVCWDFIKFLTNYERLGQAAGVGELSGFFTNKAIFNARLDNATNVGTFAAGPVLDRRSLDFIENYISDIRSSVYPGYVINTIVLSEVGAFFDGTASADAVAKRIQNRVELYLNE
jgi:multiple sugar transport system substrate-binding protein